jgi:outer membrane protein OmpA-like peptidoglycan-associated protein
MKTPMTVATLLVLGFAQTQCATAAPPSELLAARSAYDEAARGPAAKVDPADLHSAKETLDAAERSFADQGSSQETRDIAYAAERRAEIAGARADAATSLRQRDMVVAQMNSNETAQLQLTSAALGRSNRQVAAQQQALTAATQKADDADERAAQAMADLARIATVKKDARGMVITLSGSVLFASNKADMLPAGRAKLDDVANALTKDAPTGKIVVDGYTDSRGSDALNQDLSQRRAETVRAYLVARGVPTDRITAQGMGAADPIADNASAEGRADNRRVELVVQPSAP